MLAKPPLHFAHGNSFPAPCYRSFLQHFMDDYTVNYLKMSGHDPRFPVNENWENLVLEMCDFIKYHYREPIIAVGHSLGGILLFRAAILLPGYFRAVVILDAPIINQLKSSLLQFCKFCGIIGSVTPAHRTRYRRECWATREEAYAYFRTKPVFASFAPDCLRDYVDYGLTIGERGYCLMFSREIEYQIYSTIPHNLAQFQGQLQVPSALVYGSRSTVVTNSDIKTMQRYYGISSYAVSGGHLFPFEIPERAAKRTQAIIHHLLES